MQNECWGIILAAGQGRRMAEATGGEAKQFLRWKNAPLWWHSAQAMAASPSIHGLVFVFPADKKEEAEVELRKLDKSKMTFNGNIGITGSMMNPILSGTVNVPTLSIPEIPVIIENLVAKLNGRSAILTWNYVFIEILAMVSMSRMIATSPMKTSIEKNHLNRYSAHLKVGAMWRNCDGN